MKTIVEVLVLLAIVAVTISVFISVLLGISNVLDYYEVSYNVASIIRIVSIFVPSLDIAAFVELNLLALATRTPFIKDAMGLAKMKFVPIRSMIYLLYKECLCY